MSQRTGGRIAAAYRERFPKSRALYDEAVPVFPDGVTHDARYLQPFPIYVDRALGSRKHDVDGHELIDYWMGHGSLLLGHSHPAVVAAVRDQVARGTHYGACHEGEIRWGRCVQKLIRSAERVRFCSSGTEATLMALRISRIATGRTKVLKFAGHFHGWHDWLIPAADPPYLGEYPTPGIPAQVLQDLVVVPPNDLPALTAALDEHRPACVILEATGGHWGAVPMRGAFLREVRRLTAERGVIFILDEVITGFRVAAGGAQAYYDVTPDLTTLAKILAGGLPGGCLAGRADLLEALRFENRFGQKMKHPGTYNANPLSAAAGVAALELVATEEPCRHANRQAQELRRACNSLFERQGVNWVAYGEFSGVTILPEYAGPRPTSDDFIPHGNALDRLDRKIDPAFSHAFRCALLLGGVDFFGWRAMLSAAHTDADLEQTVKALGGAIARLRGDGWLT